MTSCERPESAPPRSGSRIVAGARGLPFYLDLALNQYDDISAAGGHPAADDFAGTPGEVLERFLDHLSETEVDGLRLASYPAELDEMLLGELCRTFLGGAAGADWGRLMQRSYVTQGDPGRATMHAVMRETLQAREERTRAVVYRDIHRHLFERYERLARSAGTARDVGEAHDRALLAAARHLAASDRQRLVSWILEPRWQVFYDAGRWRALSAVFEQIDDDVQLAPGGDRRSDAIWFNHHYAHICQFMGRNHQAKMLYERARQNYPKEALGTPDPDYATILQALADVDWALGNQDEAETLYADAITIYEAAPDRNVRRYANALFSLAQHREAAGRHAEADAHFQKARDVFESLSDRLPTDYADALLRFGRVRQAQGRSGEAEALYRQALDIYDRPSGDRDGYATALLDLAVCLASRGDTRGAEAAFRTAVSLAEAALGPEHPNLGRALHLQAAAWMDDEFRRSDAMSQLGRAIEILDSSLGPEHVWTKEARADLARLQGARVDR